MNGLVRRLAARRVCGWRYGGRGSAVPPARPGAAAARAARPAGTSAPSTSATAVRGASRSARAWRQATSATTSDAPAMNHRKVITRESDLPPATLSKGIRKCQGAALYSRPDMSERRKTLLIVDDDEGMRETLTAMLKRDYRVLRAATGEAGAPDDGEGGRRPDAARRPPARHQRLRGAQDRQGELSLRRGDRHLGDQGARRRDRGDAPRRLSLHLEGLRRSRACGRWSPTPASGRI